MRRYLLKLQELCFQQKIQQNLGKKRLKHSRPIVPNYMYMYMYVKGSDYSVTIASVNLVAKSRQKQHLSVCLLIHSSLLEEYHTKIL